MSAHLRLGLPFPTSNQGKEVHVGCVIWVCEAGFELRAHWGYLGGQSGIGVFDSLIDKSEDVQHMILKIREKSVKL